MTDTTPLTTAEALAEIQRHLAALKREIEQRRFAEAAVISIANSNDLVGCTTSKPTVANAAMGLLYGASDTFEKIHDDWDDLLSNLTSAAEALAQSVSVQEREVSEPAESSRIS